MKIHALLLLVLLLIGVANATYFAHTIEKNGTAIHIRQTRLIEGNMPYQKNIGEYILEHIDIQDNIQYSINFTIPDVFMTPPREWFDENGTQVKFRDDYQKPLSRVVVYAPYYYTVKGAQLKTNNKIIDYKELLEYNRCNINRICDKRENSKACPQDCPSGSSDNFCDKVSDGKCDPDCLVTEDQDCKHVVVPETASEKRDNNLWFIIIAIVLVLIVAAFLIHKRRDKSNEGRDNRIN